MTRPTLISWAATAAIVLAAGSYAVAQSGSGSFPGEQVDPVSGYPCVTPFCDTVRVPGTDCLCQKSNPGATRREDVRFVCTDMTTRNQCRMPN